MFYLILITPLNVGTIIILTLVWWFREITLLSITQLLGNKLEFNSRLYGSSVSDLPYYIVLYCLVEKLIRAQFVRN